MPPRWLIFIALLATIAAVLPFAIVARVRATPDANRGVHIFQDMVFQPKFKTQTKNPLFADQRSMRPAVLGAVARDETYIDAHYWDGTVQGEWAESLPSQLQLTDAFIKRGQERFNIYCSACHGFSGYGNGIVNQRAMALMADTNGPVAGTRWVAAKSLHDPLVREHRLGMLFNIVSNGIRNMAGYQGQITTDDRWAIACYVQALQRSQNASTQDVPPELRKDLSLLKN
ncbi:MAG: cytochrome c [Planctomycetota bacterium]|nr:MAG: cytochrome c [Planctomycetota bacterium]RLS91914.1 MAG: cytochrome c [Planctomycetota bacterium]